MADIVGCTTVGYLKFPLDRALEGIAASGLRNVELGSIPNYCEHVNPNAGATKTARLQKALADHGLTALSISCHSALATTDGAAHVLACIEYAATLGLRIVNTGTGPIGGEAAPSFYANAAKLATAAERLGVTIALETQDWEMTSGAGGTALLERLGSPAFKVNLDAANIIYWGGHRPEDEIDLLAPHVAHVHVKDKRGGRGVYEFPPLGSGEINYARLLAALDAVSFTGPYMFEPELSLPEAERPADEVAEALRDPGSAYKTHSYLGTDDPTAVDADLAESLATFNQLRAVRT